MSYMSDMPTTTLSVAVGPRTGKIIKNGLRVFERKNGLRVFERGENATKWYIHLSKLSLCKFNQSSEIVLQS